MPTGPPATHANAEVGTAANQNIADPSHRMGTKGIAVRIPPGKIGWSRNRHFQFHQLVIGFQFVITQRPIRADAVSLINAKVRWMEARSECRPMDGAAANTLAAIIASKREGMSYLR